MSSRRPGPRADFDGRGAVLDAAERLYSRNWYESVSLRAVAREASVNPAALSHHFADREALLSAVVERRGERFAQHTLDRLLALEASSAVVITEVMRALVEPYVEVIADDPVGGYHWVKLMVALAMREHPAWLRLGDGDPPVWGLTHSLLGRALPELPDEVLVRRAPVAVFGLLSIIATADLPAHVGSLDESGLSYRFVDELVEFAAAGLSRPL